jgi:molecular chaperone GrpE
MKEKNKKEEILDEEVIEETPNEEEIVEDIKEEISEIDLLKKEVDKLKNDYARAYADTENLKKRLNAEAEQTRKYRIQSFAMEILPTIDNLERALNSEVPEDAKAFYDGIKIIYDQLINALKNEGVKEIEALDKPFDASYHQALMTEKKEDKEAGIVIEVLQKGYMLKDRILRPAMVKVSE